MRIGAIKHYLKLKRKEVKKEVKVIRAVAIIFCFFFILGFVTACAPKQAETPPAPAPTTSTEQAPPASEQTSSPPSSSEAPSSTTTAQQTFPADNGPATIDVSKYPADKQETYKIFEEKCSKCHTLARAINANRFGEVDWAPVINKMATRPGSDVTPEEEKKILDFVVYDYKQRKAEIEKFWASQPK